MKGLLRSLSVYGGFRGFSSRGELRLDGVKDIVAVASGKGGVGKSTTAVNLAVALANMCQLKVGLLDADIYGPSVPTMMQIHERPDVTEDKKMVPIEMYAVKCMSMGLLVEKDAPIVWRGPMVMNALEKLTRGVHWGNLDILVVDMPPGTGDTQISMTQRLQLSGFNKDIVLHLHNLDACQVSGVLIVSTPQDVALIDARRGARMFAKVQVPILGIIENMSYFNCPHCGEPSFIFGKGGTQKTADEMGLECIAKIPLQGDIRERSDEGFPIVLSAPNSDVSRAYSDLAHKVVDKLKGLAEQQLPHMEFHL